MCVCVYVCVFVCEREIWAPFVLFLICQVATKNSQQLE